MSNAMNGAVFLELAQSACDISVRNVHFALDHVLAPGRPTDTTPLRGVYFPSGIL